ncbi:MAG TPA: mechanosensitive ion channel domain-containing protein [Desulfobacterales bacterium]|nr:mechanosensitive ion channel domain-containing protein [Desulfobacterales bacterium]
MITTESATARQAASLSSSVDTADTAIAEDLETLAATIKNDQTRQQLLDQIQALIAVKKGTDLKQDDRPISERLTEAATATVQETTQTFAEIGRFFPHRQALEDWIRKELSDPAKLGRNAKKALPFVLIFGVAWLVEFLAARLLAGLRKRSEKQAPGTLANRLPLSVFRAALRICAPAAFAVAALAVFLFLQPGPVIGKVSFQMLAAYIAGRVLMILVRMVLAPSTPSLRLVSLSSESAYSIFKSTRRLVTVALVGYLLVSTALLFGLPPRGFAALTNLLGMILTMMLIAFILKNRSAVADWIRGVDLPSARRRTAIRSARRCLAAVWHIIAIVYLSGLFIVWWQHIAGGLIYLVRSTLLTALVVFAAWLLVHGLRRAVESALTVGEERDRLFPSLKHRAKSYVTPVLIIIRGAVALIAILSVMEAWKLDAYRWLTTPVGRHILSVFLSIVLVVGIAVTIWEVVNIATERYLAETEKSGKTPGRSARTRTLLPLMRKALLMVLSIIVVLIVLSEIGVHIGPLLAGAGILGLAVGFGAQKLVQDIITGVFILMEDAVAVGDVVKVAGIGGLVEDLSIRSIRLRDLSGNVHTIPFSSVDTVTNMTKLYSYYLIDIAVAYREDTDQVADVCRAIVDGLRADPEFGPDILEPLEVLGVDQFADSAVIIKARIKTRPIKQWTVGREFNRRMKKRFDELGIEIPFPHRTLYFGAGKDGSAPPLNMALDQT